MFNAIAEELRSSSGTEDGKQRLVECAWVVTTHGGDYDVQRFLNRKYIYMDYYFADKKLRSLIADLEKNYENGKYDEFSDIYQIGIFKVQYSRGLVEEIEYYTLNEDTLKFEKEQ